MTKGTPRGTPTRADALAVGDVVQLADVARRVGSITPSLTGHLRIALDPVEFGAARFSWVLRFRPEFLLRKLS